MRTEAHFITCCYKSGQSHLHGLQSRAGSRTSGGRMRWQVVPSHWVSSNCIYLRQFLVFPRSSAVLCPKACMLISKQVHWPGSTVCVSSVLHFASHYCHTFPCFMSIQQHTIYCRAYDKCGQLHIHSLTWVQSVWKTLWMWRAGADLCSSIKIRLRGKENLI